MLSDVDDRATVAALIAVSQGLQWPRFTTLRSGPHRLIPFLHTVRILSIWCELLIDPFISLAHCSSLSSLNHPLQRQRL